MLPKTASASAENSLDTDKLNALMPLLRQINNLKRIKHWGDTSIATFRFEQGWRALISKNVREVAGKEVSLAVISCIMRAISSKDLLDLGLNAAEIKSVFNKALRDPQLGLDEKVINRLSETLPEDLAEDKSTKLPTWASRLRYVERAGATCPNKASIVLQPQENHADHCWVVAAYASLIAIVHNDDASDAFLLGMAHHMVNAWLPDGGYAGEIALGDHLSGIMQRAEKKSVDELPQPLAEEVRSLLDKRNDLSYRSAIYFNAADALDRVLQMEWFETAAAFKLSHATEDMEIVHAGPLQEFQNRILKSVGLSR